jgi:hypothetical protein
MRRAKRLAAATMALVLTGATGVSHGLWTGRWRTDHTSSASAARVNRIPMTLGDWEGQELPLDRDEMGWAGIASGWMRRYENRVNGESVTVMLIAGAPGPISVHTPEVCYPASGYEQDGPSERRTIAIDDARPAQFWAADFRKETSPIPSRLRVYWAWGTAGTWSAPYSPRITFAREDVLYKVYVVRTIPLAGDGERADASVEFIKQLTREWTKRAMR